jgi:tRNA-dihydrouridine synthase B
MLFKNNTVVAAPMAGISDSVFRILCKEHGADIVVSEMVSVEGILYGADATMELMRFSSGERPIGIQLFGSDPDHFKRVAPIVTERFNPDFIDINAGCPVQKIVRRNGGASLLRNLALFESIIKSTIAATHLPVTVKLRSGWNKYEWVDREFALCAEAIGAAAITVHPRSQTMMFSGHSFWERINMVKTALKIPVIGNGDVVTADDAAKMKNETECDGIMIGRGACGNPWIFDEVKTTLAGECAVPPTTAEKEAVALRHIALFRDQFGEKRAAKEMKKHTAWYIKGMPGASLQRDRIFRAESSRELEDAVKTVFGL